MDRHGDVQVAERRLRVKILDAPSGRQLVATMLLAWEILKGWVSTPRDTQRWYWYVTYDYGFVRRGLAGELVQAVSQDFSAVDFAVRIGGVAPAALLAVVAFALVRRQTPAEWGLGLLILASPFTIQHQLFVQRPDQLGLLVIALAGISLTTRKPWRLPFLIATGVILSILVLIHEVTLLECLPWLFLLEAVLGHGSWRVSLRHLIPLLAPALLSATAVVAKGSKIGPIEIAAMKTSAGGLGLMGVDSFDFLDDGLTQSWGYVALYGWQLFPMLVLGLALLALHAAAVAGFGLPVVAPSRARVMLVATACAGSLTIQMATGIDWLRWIANLGAYGLLSLGVIVLRRRDSWAPLPQKPASWALAPVAVLALVPPVPVFLLPPEVYTYWLDALRGPYLRVMKFLG